MKAYIITIVASSSTLEEAVAAIRSQAELNKDFNSVINDLRVTKKIINVLVDKFGGYHEVVARSLGTPDAKEYVEINNTSLDRLAWGNKPLQDIEKYLASGADINYIDKHGYSLVSYISPYTPELITYLINHGINVNAISHGAVSLIYQVSQKSETLDPKAIMLLLSKMKPVLLNYPMSAFSGGQDRASFTGWPRRQI